MGRGDVEAIIALYDPNAVFSGMRGDVRTGLDEIRQDIARIAATKPTLHMKPKKLLVVVSRGTAADSTLRTFAKLRLDSFLAAAGTPDLASREAGPSRI